MVRNIKPGCTVHNSLLSSLFFPSGDQGCDASERLWSEISSSQGGLSTTLFFLRSSFLQVIKAVMLLRDYGQKYPQARVDCPPLFFLRSSFLQVIKAVMLLSDYGQKYPQSQGGLSTTLLSSLFFPSGDQGCDASE